MRLLHFAGCDDKIVIILQEVAMMLALLSIPLMVLILAFFIYPSYSEGKQLKNGATLYSNQEPKLK
jgi:hypothetical protein